MLVHCSEDGCTRTMHHQCVEEFEKDIGYNDIKLGDMCEEGHQLRPHIVWFGESVPNMTAADELAYDADIFVVIGTSLVVYPAALLVSWTQWKTPIYVIDPGDISLAARKSTTTYIKKKATEGVKDLYDILMKED